MPLRTTDDQDRSVELRDAIDRTGYYPDVVADSVSAAVAGERVVSFYVHHEPTFDRDEVRRHLSVVVLTPSRLIIVHTDEHAGDDLLPEPYTSTSSEAIRLSSVTSVVVTRMVANPTKGPSSPAEAVITLGWGGGDAQGEVVGGQHPGVAVVRLALRVVAAGRLEVHAGHPAPAQRDDGLGGRAHPLGRVGDHPGHDHRGHRAQPDRLRRGRRVRLG